MKQESAKKLIDQVHQFIRDSRHLLSQGKEVELAPLQGQVEGLCQAIATMPKETGKNYEGHLLELMGELSMLEQELKSAQAKIRDELAGLSLYRKASVAYKSADFSRLKKEETE